MFNNDLINRSYLFTKGGDVMNTIPMIARYVTRLIVLGLVAVLVTMIAVIVRR